MNRQMQIESLDSRQMLTSLIGDSSVDQKDPIVEAFVANCEEAGGGFSTNPDGTTECTIDKDKYSDRDSISDEKVRESTDRSKDDDEPGLPGVTIYLDLNGNG